MYLTYIQIVSLEILPNYQCIKGPTIESIVVPLFYLKASYNAVKLYNQNDPTILCIVGFVLCWSSHVQCECAPIKEIYDIVTLTCTNCLNWLKYLRNTSKIDLMMNCIVGLRIYHKN